MPPKRKFVRTTQTRSGVYIAPAEEEEDITITKFIDKNLNFISTLDIVNPMIDQGLAPWSKPLSGAEMKSGIWFICQSIVNNKQGPGTKERNGYSFTIKKISLNIGFVIAPRYYNYGPGQMQGKATSFYMDCLLVLDKQPSGKQVIANDIFKVRPNNQPLIPYLTLLENSKRFEILFHKREKITFGPERGAEYFYRTLQTTKMFNLERFTNIVVTNKGKGEESGWTTITTNNILLLCGMDSYFNSTNGNMILQAGRIWFLPFGWSRIEFED